MFLFTEEGDRRKIAEVSSAANSEIYSDPQVLRDSEQWVRTKWSSVQKLRDGLPIDTFGLPPLTAAIAKMMITGMLRKVPARSARHNSPELMLSAPLLGLIAVRRRCD